MYIPSLLLCWAMDSLLFLDTLLLYFSSCTSNAYGGRGRREEGVKGGGRRVEGEGWREEGEGWREEGGG